MNELWMIERVALDRSRESTRQAEAERGRRLALVRRPRLAARTAELLRRFAERLDATPQPPDLGLAEAASRYLWLHE